MSRVGLSSQHYAPGQGRAEPLDHPVMEQQASESARGVGSQDGGGNSPSHNITITLLTVLSLAGRVILSGSCSTPLVFPGYVLKQFTQGQISNARPVI